MSNSSTKIAKTAKSWAGFEAECFGVPSFVNEEADGGFEMQEIRAEEKEHFVPLEIGEGGDIKREAEDILEEAKNKAAVLQRDAYEKGFAQGEKDGLELGEKKGTKLAEHMENLLAELSKVKTEFPKLYEKEMLGIVFAIAKKIVNFQVESDKSVIKETVFKTIELASEKSKVILKVNPEDFEYIDELKPRFIVEFNDINSIVVTPDASITRGGCLLETPYGDVDARIESQFERLIECLEATFAEREDE